MSFYWLHPKGSGFTRIGAGKMHRWPTDWIDMKLILTEVVARLHQEHDVTSGILMLERHLPGKKFIGFQGYRLSPFGYKRDFEGYFKVEYSSLSQELHVPQAVFGFSLSFLTAEYLALEKGREHRVPPVVPREYQGLGEKARHLLMEPSGLRYVDYARKPRTGYHDPDSEYYAHMPSYSRQPSPLFELKGRFEKVLPPQA